MSAKIYVRREATPEEVVAMRELRANPERYRWCVNGRCGYSVAAIHDRLPYITFVVARANDEYHTPSKSRQAICRAIADDHNAQLEGATK